eukprot:4487396-Prorocentrum_lima.AAC.1
MIKHCDTVMVPGLVVTGGYQGLSECLSVLAMLQENFGLLSCFLPEEVGVFILERLAPFAVPTTFAPHRLQSENVRTGWADVGRLFIFSDSTLSLRLGRERTAYGDSLSSKGYSKPDQRVVEVKSGATGSDI